MIDFSIYIILNECHLNSWSFSLFIKYLLEMFFDDIQMNLLWFQNFFMFLNHGINFFKIPFFERVAIFSPRTGRIWQNDIHKTAKMKQVASLTSRIESIQQPTHID